MEIQLTGPKTLRLQSSAVAYILDTLSLRPYKDVRALIDEIFLQLKQQEIANESIGTADSATDGGVQHSSPAD